MQDKQTQIDFIHICMKSMLNSLEKTIRENKITFPFAPSTDYYKRTNYNYSNNI